MAGRRPFRRLDAGEFEAAAGRLRMAAKNVAFARAVMVDGLRVTDVAQRSGVTSQQLSQAVRRIYECHLAHADVLPVDWRRITVTVPPALADQIAAVAERAAETYHRTRKLDEALVFSHERKSAGRG